MAYIKEIPIKQTVGKAIKYITDSLKTDGQVLIADSGISFQNADALWEKIRDKFGKNKNILAHHFVQSFDPKHNITVEEAQKIGKELAERQFGKLGLDYIIATHIDSGIIHNHIIVNSVSRTGKKYYHNKKTYSFLRRLNIDVCRDNGIPAIDHGDNMEMNSGGLNVNLNKWYKDSRYVTYNKTEAYKKRESAKKDLIENIKHDIDKTILVAKSWNDFIGKMQSLGYRVDYKTQSGADKKYVTYYPPVGQGKRDRSLGLDMYSRLAIEKRIEEKLSEILKVNGGKYTSKNKKSMKQKYYLDPKWEKMMFSLKSNYRRRSYLEQMLIMSLLKKNDSKKPTINRYEKKSEKINYHEYYKNSKLYNDDLDECIKTIRSNNFHNVTDIQKTIFVTIKEIQGIEEELAEIENLLYKIENFQKLHNLINGHFQGQEQGEHFKQRNNIQRYQILKRELKNVNINIDILDDELQRFRMKYKEFNNKKEDYNKDLKSYNMAINILGRKKTGSQIENSKGKGFKQKEDKEK